MAKSVRQRETITIDRDYFDHLVKVFELAAQHIEIKDALYPKEKDLRKAISDASVKYKREALE